MERDGSRVASVERNRFRKRTEPRKGDGAPHAPRALRLAVWPAAVDAREATPARDAEYEVIFERARLQIDHRLRRMVDEQIEAARLYPRLIGRSPAHLRLLLCNLPLDRALSLVVLLVEEAQRRAFDAPGDALEHALLAARVAERLSHRHCGECLVEELSARVWACVGTARRRTGEPGAAAEAFRRARAHLARGCGEPLEEALVMEQQAAFDATRRRWIEAARSLAQAAVRFRRVGDRHLEARVRIKQGVLELLRDRRRAAMEPLTRGLDELEGEREPYVAAMGHTLLAALLAESRMLPSQSRAREALRKARCRLTGLPDGSVRELVARVEARILRGVTSGAVTRPGAATLLPMWPRCL